MFGLRPIAVVHTESLGSGGAYKLGVGRWDSRCFGFVGNGQMCSGMVFTASGMLTKQTSVQHPFGNAADGSERPGMGSGLVRDCSGGVWTASRHE